MLQNGNVRAMPMRRSPQRVLVIAIVAAIHVVLIAAFISGVGTTILTTPGPLQYVIPKYTQPPPARPPVNPRMYNPTGPTVPQPVITIEDTNPNRTITPPPIGGTTGGTVMQSFAPAQPILATHTVPPYPPIGTRMGHEGNVMLRVVIDPMGNVAQAQVVRSSGFPELDEAAVAWVRGHWRYVPAMRNGVSAASTADITVTFRLTMR